MRMHWNLEPAQYKNPLKMAGCITAQENVKDLHSIRSATELIHGRWHRR